MTWKERIANAMGELTKVRQTTITDTLLAAGLQPNIISKLKAGRRKVMDIDELDQIAKILKYTDVIAFLQAIEQIGIVVND